VARLKYPVTKFDPVLGDEIEKKSIDPETIIAVVPERCSGPGWGNAILWVYWRDSAGRIQQESLQPDEQSSEIMTLFRVCETAHHAMLQAVRRHVAT
jgi:hypothetical protein